MTEMQETEYRKLTTGERIGILLRHRLRDREKALAAALDMDALRAEIGKDDEPGDSTQIIRESRDKR